MAWLSKWRLWIITALLIWSIFLIHPLNKEGLELSKVDYPAAPILQKGDILESINGQEVTSLTEFKDLKQGIDYNDTVSVYVLRETFPYTYQEIDHLYIPAKNDTVGFKVKEIQPTNMFLSYELTGGNKFYLSVEGDIEETKEVLNERLPLASIDDYTIYEEDNQLVVLSSSGEELTDIVETKGDFVAKVGNETFFSSNDIENICLSGVDCDSYLYQVMNESSEASAVVWKYGFEARLTEEAAQRFANISNSLSIAKCELSNCILNETIDFYLDGEKIGSEDIYSVSKGKSKEKVSISGIAPTSSEAQEDKRFLQAVLQGKTDVEVQKIEKLPSIFTTESLIGLFVFSGLIILTGPVVVWIQTRKLFNFGLSLFTNIAEIGIVLGLLAGLNIVISSVTLISLMLVPVASAVYQNLAIRNVKKAGTVRKKLYESNSKINKWTLAAIAILFVVSFISQDFAAPLLSYSILMLTITKGFFFKYLVF